MEQILGLLGDGISIAALSIIASVSLSAYQRMLPTAKLPIQFRRNGEPGYRLPRLIGAVFTPAWATVLLMMPMAMQLTRQVQGSEAIMLFVVRVIFAGFVAYAHLVHMRHAMMVLSQEGQLRT